jgi:plastocyanin domain-containing protein
MSETPMTREAFLNSVGAKSKNKYWSWSAVNEEKNWIIFGAWDVHTKNGREMILSEDWEFNEKTGRKQPGYSEGYQNIQLVIDKGYAMFDF